MSSPTPGEVILVSVPFTDLTQTKRRPAMVLLSRGSDHLVSFLTSRLDNAGAEEVIVRRSAENGLAIDSAVIIAKLFTLHESLVARRLGRLSKSDHRAVVERLVGLLQAALARSSKPT